MSHPEQGILRLLSGVLLALGEKRVFGVIRVIEDHQALRAVYTAAVLRDLSLQPVGSYGLMCPDQADHGVLITG
jgi:hypothetical protein